MTDVWLFSGWPLIGAILLLLWLAYTTGRADGYRQGRRDEQWAQVAAREREASRK